MEKKYKLFSNSELQQLVERISVESFNRPFVHRARFNPRLRTTGGRYLLHTHDIEINPKQYEFFGEDVLSGIIKHELCHYHLHLQGRGYKHRDSDFIRLMEKVGAPRFCETIPGTTNQQRVTHLYECINCKQQYSRKRRINVERYVCGRCRGKLNKLK